MEKNQDRRKGIIPAGVFAVGPCAIPLVGAVFNRARVADGAVTNRAYGVFAVA